MYPLPQETAEGEYPSMGHSGLLVRDSAAFAGHGKIVETIGRGEMNMFGTLHKVLTCLSEKPVYHREDMKNTRNPVFRVIIEKK